MGKYVDPRSTPLGALLHAAANGSQVSDDELAAVPLPRGKDRAVFETEQRRRFSVLKKTYDDGNHQTARSIAADYSEGYLLSFGEDGLPPEADRALAEAGTDPDKLADLIPRSPFG